MANRNTTLGSWISVVCAPKIYNSNTYVIYRNCGQEVEFRISNSEIKVKNAKLKINEIEYIKRKIIDGKREETREGS
ncbi:MAG: hypothetical protein ACRCU6_02220 [Fusobacteriaceae bacterium]